MWEQMVKAWMHTFAHVEADGTSWLADNVSADGCVVILVASAVDSGICNV